MASPQRIIADEVVEPTIALVRSGVPINCEVAHVESFKEFINRQETKIAKKRRFWKRSVSESWLAYRGTAESCADRHALLKKTTAF